MNTTAQPSGSAAPAGRFEVDPTLPGLSFTGTFVSEFTKLLALRTTWWLSGSTLVTGIFIAVMFALTVEYFDASGQMQQQQPAALASQSMTGMYFAMIMLGALGVIAITTEFSTGSIRSALTAVPRRSTLIAAKMLALCAWAALITGAMVLVIHVAVGVIAEPLSLSSLITDGDVALTYLTSWATVVLTALMGFGLGALLRSSAGAIVTLTIILFVVQIALSIIWGLSDGAAWAEALMRMEYMFLIGEFTSASEPQAPFGPDPLQRWQAGLGMLAWAGIPVLLGWLSFARRDS